jgi:F-type H+-transporting ATPase subunit epsilon
MAGTFKFELVTPERIELSEDVEQVLVPGMEGQFTVLPGHTPVISTLRPGVVEVTRPDARRTRIYVKGGVAEVDAEHVTLLAERALDLEAVEPATIAEELEAAEADLAAAADDAARLVAAAAVESLRSLRR